MIRKRRCRKEYKKKLEGIFEKFPEVKNDLKVRDSNVVGRPRLEVDQPELLETIVNIAIHGSASHEKRREDIYRSVKSLNELAEALKEDGFKLSRSATYLRLLPRRSNSLEGKRHVLTVPVRLTRAQNDLHASHADAAFTTVTISYLEELASLLGPKQVAFISQDDKARVPIGVTAAHKQSPILLHVEYRVKLPDHDCVKASRHKLIPSVYAGIALKENGLGNKKSVGFSGPPFIFITSGKHSSSNAHTHGRDIEFLFDDDSHFKNIMNIDLDGKQISKPVLIIISDGGPDENPRYQNVVEVAVHHFVKRDLDGIFIATNAPGRSAYNRVERRMAPLSRDLCGLVLPHDHYGNHLNNQSETIDVDLEKRNFQKAGETLAQIWSETIIDGYPTVAKFTDEDGSDFKEYLIKKNASWMDAHVTYGQYVLQISKCNNAECCKQKRSCLHKILSNGKLPPPFPLNNEGRKITVPSGDYRSLRIEQFASLFVNLAVSLAVSANTHDQCFDKFCPSVQSKIESRTCPICQKYFSTLTFLKSHQKLHREQKHREKTLKAIHATTPKLRPKRIAAITASEALAIMYYDLDMEDAEWHNIEQLDLEMISTPLDNNEVIKLPSKLPIVSVENNMTIQWQEM